MASANDDVPLGEGARQYYEKQFGARIRQVRKGGAPGGPGWRTRAGGGVVVIVVLLALRALLGLGRSSHPTPPMPSYHLDPPPVEVDPQVEEANRNLREGLERLQRESDKQERWRNLPGGMGGLNPAEDLKAVEPSPRFEAADLPLPEGLCYRIDKESRQPGPSPGRRLCQVLDAPTRALIERAAAGGGLMPEETGALCHALNMVLERRDFFDEDSFRKVELPLKVHQLARGEGEDELAPARRTELLNRLALEAAYPRQIIPWQQRPALDEQSRAQWQLRALQDYRNAKRFE